MVVGGDAVEQRRYGDTIGKGSRYARADEFLAVVRELWTGEEVNFSGEWFEIEGARLLDPPAWPTVYLGGSSAAAIEVAARRADVFLTWGEPPEAVAAKLDTVREAAEREGRELGFGIRLHVITRDTAEEAWEVADRLLAGLSPEQIAKAQSIQAASESEGQRRMRALHGGRTDHLEVSPNLWAGHRPRPRRRRHRPGRLPRGSRRPHRRVPRPRHRRVHPLRLPPPRGGLPSRRGPPV